MPERGDRVHGYVLLQNFATTSGGNGMWSFAERGDRQFFIKEFLSPTYPDESAPGSEEVKREKMIRCRIFERRHLYLWRALQPYADDGYGLVVTRDFFRWGRKYYKITDRIDVADLGIEDIYRVPSRQKKSVLIGATLGLRLLHRLRIVHGDVKPANILVAQSTSGTHRTKLIDFDNSYTAGSPPPAEDLVGDLVYYSPETARYVHEERDTTRSDLTCASDIFALGLMYCQYLTGRLPDFDERQYQYAWAAVEDGRRLVARPETGTPAPIIERMLLRDYRARPSIEEVFAAIRVFAASGARRPSRTVRDDNRGAGTDHTPDADGDSSGRGTLRRIAGVLTRALEGEE